MTIKMIKKFMDALDKDFLKLGKMAKVSLGKPNALEEKIEMLLEVSNIDNQQLTDMEKRLHTLEVQLQMRREISKAADHTLRNRIHILEVKLGEILSDVSANHMCIEKLQGEG